MSDVTHRDLAETFKLLAEERKLDAEARKLRREMYWMPWQVVSVALGAAAGIVVATATLIKVFGL